MLFILSEVTEIEMRYSKHIEVFLWIVIVVTAFPIFAGGKDESKLPERVKIIQTEDGSETKSSSVEGEVVGIDKDFYILKVDGEIKKVPWKNVRRIDGFINSGDMLDSSAKKNPSSTQPISTTGTRSVIVSRIFDDLSSRFMTYSQRELLVVFIVDNSPSLQDDRQVIGNEIDRIINLVGNRKVINTAVIGLNEQPVLKLSLTRDMALAKQAIQELGTKGSGTENVMAALEFSCRTFINPNMKKIFIVVTDEKGDDANKVEAALGLLKKNDVTVYVLGGEATFNMSDGTETYTNYDDKGHTSSRTVSIDSGKESAFAEIIVAGISCASFYLGKGTDSSLTKSGFGPFELSRICQETSGKYYFLKGPSYPAGIIKNYTPDLCSSEEYVKLNKKDTIRSVVTGILSEFNEFRKDEWLNNLPYYFFDQATMKNAAQSATKAFAKIKTLIPKMEACMAAVDNNKNSSDKRWIANSRFVLGQLYRAAFLLNQYTLCLQNSLNKWDASRPPLQKETDEYHAERYVIDLDDYRESSPIDKDSDVFISNAVQIFQKIVVEHSNTPWSLAVQKIMRRPYGFTVKRERIKKSPNYQGGKKY